MLHRRLFEAGTSGRRTLANPHVRRGMFAWWAYTAVASIVAASPAFTVLQGALEMYPAQVSRPLLLDHHLLAERWFPGATANRELIETTFTLAVLAHLGASLPLTFLIASLGTKANAPRYVPWLKALRGLPGVLLLTIAGQLALVALLAFGVWVGGDLLLEGSASSSRILGAAWLIACGAVALFVGRPLLDLARVAHVQRRRREGLDAIAPLAVALEALLRRPVRMLVANAVFWTVGWICAVAAALGPLHAALNEVGWPAALGAWLIGQAGMVCLLACRTAWFGYCLGAVRDNS